MSDETHNISPEAMDNAEPKSDMSPAPVLLIGAFTLLFYLGMLYLDKHGGEFDEHVYFPYTSSNDVYNSTWHPPEDPQVKMGKEVFKACAACHQASALGVAGQYPPLAGSDWVNAKSPDRIIRIVLDGLGGPITVSGQSFNNQMLAWKGIYDDEHIAAVLTYVRGNKGWNNGAPPVTADQVKAIRAKIADHPGPFTPDELLKIPLDEK